MKSGLKVLSFVLSPIIFPILGTILYFTFLPSFVPKEQVYLILIVIFGGTYLLPVVLLGLFKKSKVIKNYFLKTVEERKFPTVMFFGISISIGNILSKVDNVEGLTIFFLGYALALAVTYLFLLRQSKISMHAIAIGGLTAFVVCLSHYYALNLLVVIAVLIGVGGFIISARLYLKTHSLREVTIGYFVGVFGQLMIYAVYSM